MKRILAGLLVLTLTATFAPPPAVYAADPVAVDADVAPSGSVASDGDAERWWGAAGAIVCGLGLNLMRRFWPAATIPAVVAPTLGGCLLAAMDVATT
jgi:hypothetical protein